MLREKRGKGRGEGYLMPKNQARHPRGRRRSGKHALKKIKKEGNDEGSKNKDAKIKADDSG